jgi:NAD(P)-dependent dehydrogenase (short-subunit alcohol dehydrogenase family)
MAADFGLSGQVAVVTGSTSGIGLALARQLAGHVATPPEKLSHQ